MKLHIETEKYYLRDLEERDAEGMFLMDSDPDVMKYLGNEPPKTMEDVQNTLVRINMLDPGWLRTDLGGENADNPVEAVMPGALTPALIQNDGPNGHEFSALNHNLTL